MKTDWDRLVESWSTRTPLSEHMALEIAHTVHVDHKPGDAPPLKADAPVPGCSCERCTGVPKPVKPPTPRRTDAPLPVEDARAVPILTVVDRLGLGPVRRAGQSHRIRCPFHDDRKPSLSIDVNGLWYCYPCGEGGDGIELWMRVRGVPFVDAVRELTT